MEKLIEKYWADVLAILKNDFTDVTYETHIKILKPLYIEEGIFYLKAPHSFFKDTIESRYLKNINAAVKIVTTTDTVVNIVTEESYKKGDDKTSSNLVPKYIFENFVKAKSNEFAYATAVAVAESPGMAHNPLFLYGGVGLGKTHLMHSIGNHIKIKCPNKKILYCSMETFTNELIHSIQTNKNQQFRDKYRDTDVLLVDDIQFLTDKERTQEEFFHTFNILYDANKQIVISSDKPPKELETLEDRLITRFGQGIIVDLKVPDFETRIAIVEKKAEVYNIFISKDVSIFIANNFYSNIRDLEGALNKVIAYSKFENLPITQELAEEALKDLITKKERPVVSVPLIQEIVAKHFDITVEDLKGKRKTKNIAFPRQVAMYLSRKLIDTPLSVIGKFFGGRDHSTIIHGCDKITELLESNSDLKNTIINLEKTIIGD